MSAVMEVQPGQNSSSRLRRMIPVVPVIPKKLEKKPEQSFGQKYSGSAKPGNAGVYRRGSSEQRGSLTVKSPDDVKPKEFNSTEPETEPRRYEGRNPVSSLHSLTNAEL